MQSPFASPFAGSYKQPTSKLFILIWVTVFWLTVALYQYFDRYANFAIEGHIDSDYEHWPYIRGLLISVIIGGAIAGTVIVFLWEKWLRNLPFVRVIAFIVLWYIGLYTLITWVGIFLYSSFDSSVAENGVIATTLNALFDLKQLPNFIFWLFIMFITMGFLLVRDKFGPGMFGAYLRGKYFRPKREERIFMFMDLKSSTTIAEELGEERYFNFLNDTFRIATPGILATYGEIYQYVGDEVVVSWDIKRGLKQASCLRCYYEMTRRLEEQEDYFVSKYRFTPIFKAGLHSGFVIAGEMGVIKKEIAYSGDVLNTTARIQAKCNDFDVRILISKILMDQIDESLLAVEPKEVGDLVLKGKAKKVTVVTI